MVTKNPDPSRIGIRRVPIQLLMVAVHRLRISPAVIDAPGMALSKTGTWWPCASPWHYDWKISMNSTVELVTLQVKSGAGREFGRIPAIAGWILEPLSNFIPGTETL
jgi:hypothetical protein